MLKTFCEVVACPMRSRAKATTTSARPDAMSVIAASVADDPVAPPVLTRKNGAPGGVTAPRTDFSTQFTPPSASGATPATTASTSFRSNPASASASLTTRKTRSPVEASAWARR